MRFAEPAGRLPDKLAGRHRWIASVAFTLSPGQAHNAHEGNAVVLDYDNAIGLQVACLDCGGGYEATRNEPCPSEEFKWAYKGIRW